MIQPIIIMLVGLSWVSAALFFRHEIDPLYAQMPLMASLVILLVLLLHAIVLGGIGRNLGRPYLSRKGKKKSSRGIPPPSFSFVAIWSFIGLSAMLAGFAFRSDPGSLSLSLWILGGVTLLASLCFLLIPSQVHSENAEGEIIFKPNPVRMAPKAIYFWTSAIIYGGFFLISGATVSNTSGMVSLISMGTGAGWLLGATILSLVALFRMGISDEEHQTSKSNLLVPSEDFSQIAGNPEIKSEMAQILYQVTNAQKGVGSAPNGILLTGSSSVGRTIMARALAGEYKRPLFNLSLDSLLTVDSQTFENHWKGFLFKIKPFNPLIIYIENYGNFIRGIQGNPQGLHNVQTFLTRMAKNRTHLLIASADKTDDLPKFFISPPIINWIIPIPMPDFEMRKTLLGRFLMEEAKKNELLPGNVPLLTVEMVQGFDLGKLSALMEGFTAEDIREVVLHSSDYAQKLRRSLRQLDIDVSIRRKAQNWKDPTAGPMERVRARLTDETMAPFIIHRTSELFSNRQKKSHESILIIGRNRSIRRQIAMRLSELVSYSFMTTSDEKRLDGNEFRNLLLRARKHRPSTIFVDPVEELFPKVQLSNYGYHGELYNQKVMEISQANEDKNIWLIGGADDVNKIDPFIARRFASVLDLAELGRSLFSELEEFALGKILEGIDPDKINFAEFDHTEEAASGDSAPEGAEEQAGSLHLLMPEPLAEALPGYPGRQDIQMEVRSVLEAGKYGIKKGGSGLLGAFLFAGPRGTGKLEAARAVAHYLDPEKPSLVVRDMGLYSDRLFASMLLQRPLGSTAQSPLPVGIHTVLEERPDSVLFLDNIEQAHPSAWDFLMEYVTDGTISNGKKRLAVPKSTLILSTSLFSGDEMEELKGGNRAAMILERLGEKNGRLSFLPVFGRELLNTLDLIVPFPTYTDADLIDMARRTVYETMVSYIKGHPMKGVLDIDPEVPAFIAFQLDPTLVTLPQLQRKVQSLLLPALKSLDNAASTLTPESSLRIGIVDNQIQLTEGAPVVTEKEPTVVTAGA